MPVAVSVVLSTVRVRAGRARKVSVGLWRDGRGLEGPQGVSEVIRPLKDPLKLVVSGLVASPVLPSSVS